MSQEIKICSDASGCFVGGLSATDTVYTQKNVVADGKVCIGNSKLVLNGTAVSSCAAELNLLDGCSSACGIDCVGDITQVVAGTCLTGGGTAGCVTINHSDTSSQSSVNNSDGTVIQDVTLDGYGHVTALGSANLDGRYYTETEVDSLLSGKLSTSGCAANSALLQGNAASAFVKTSGDSTISGSLTVDDITINGSTISDAGEITIDAEGDITLDANGADIRLKDNGTEFGRLANINNNLVVCSKISDEDIIFCGNDGGTARLALTLDMSDSGAAIFNHKACMGDGKLVLNGTAVTSTATELNLLDGCSSACGIDCVGDITQVVAGTNLTGGGTAGCVTINAATGGAGAATYGSTSNGTKIDTITLDAYGRVTAVACGTTGDITSVVAGTGLTGGATSGDATLNVIGGTGITANANDVAVDSTVVRTCGSQTIAGDKSFSNDVTVAGDLTVTGDITCKDTIVSITSALSVVNTGTGPALTVQQDGTQPIACFKDKNGDDIIFADDGKVCIGNSKLVLNGTTVTRTAAQINAATSCSGTGNITCITTSTGLDGSGSSGTVNITMDLTELTLGAGLDSSATGLSLDLSELTDMTADMSASQDEVILLDNGAERRKLFCEIFGCNAYSNAGFTTCTGTTTPSNSQTFTNKGGNISQWTNNSGYTTCTGTGVGNIACITTSAGLDGSGSSGTINISLDLSELTDGTGAIVTGSDEIIYLDAGTQKRKLFCEIFGNNAYNSTAFTTCLGTTTPSNSQTFTNKGGNISQWTNNSGYTTCTGTTTNSNSQTFTNKGGNISQWTNDSGYTTCTGTGVGNITCVTTSTGLDGGASSGTATISLDLSELTDMTAAVAPGSDELILLDSGAERRKLFCEIFGSNAYTSTTIPTNNNQLTNGSGYTTCTGTTTASNSQTFTNKCGNISQWTNNSGYTTCTGDITGVTAGTLLDGGGSSGSVTLNVDLSELSTSTTNGDGDFFVVVDASNNQRKLTKGCIAISEFSNNAGYTTCTGDITNVSAGTLLDGGGSSGSVTLNVDLSELTDMTQSWATGSDEFVVLDSGSQKRKLSCEIFGSNAFNSTTIPTNNNQLTNGNGYTTCTGTTTNSNTQTFTNKSGNISQWTNDCSYIKSCDSISGNAATATNSTCAGGLAVHTGRNNEANKIVRTQANGYICAGWINTTSGNNGSTTFDRIYASSDSYIRYYTPACFGAQISSHINYNCLSNKPTIPTNNNQLTNGNGYTTCTGTTTNSNTQTFTNKSGNISQWTNNSGYTTCTGDITNVSAGVGLCGGGSSGSVTLTLDMSELTDMTATMVNTDEFIVLDNGADRRKAACEISNAIFSNGAGYTTCSGTTTSSNSQTFTNKGGNISQWTNNSGYTTCTGDITNVSVGTGLDGGGASGSVTISLDLTEVTMGTGLDSSATGLSLDLSEFTDMTGAIDTSADEIILLDNGAERRKAFCEIFGSNAYNSTTIPTNNNQLTNGNGYTTCSGTTTASNSQTFTNKGGNISQWTNNSGYTTCTGDITGVTAGTLLDGGGSSGSVTLNVDLSELTDMTAGWSNTADEFVVLDNGSQRRKLSCEIFGSNAFNSTTIPTNNNQLTNGNGYTTCTGTTTNSNTQTFTNKSGCISQWTNDSGYTTCTGDITNVSVGTGLDGGGASGSVTISLDLTEVTMGTGLDSSATGLSLDLSEFTDMTGAIDTSVDEIILLDNGAERRKRFSEIFGSNAYNSTTIPTNNNQLTNGNGYTTCTGTTTSSNSQTFTNKGGNISQWTNNSGYTTCTGNVVTTGSTFTGDILLNDSVCAKFGASSDLAIYHNATSSFIDNDKNHICIRNNVDGDDGGNIYIMPHDNENGILIHDDGAVCLYSDNAVKLCTQSYGAKTQGTHCASYDMKAPIGCFCTMGVGGQSRSSSYGIIVGNCGNCCGGGSAKFCGTVQVCGSFSKSSGCFDIVHPLPSLSATKRLSHSFVESPQADNIYSGVVDLTAGKATVNIDEIHGMTSGTLTALNRCFRTFTTNETNWDPVRGSVTGNTLTVESCVADSTATVSWMVLGERHDPHMMTSPTTDDQGRARVEYTPPADIYSDGDWEEL